MTRISRRQGRENFVGFICALLFPALSPLGIAATPPLDFLFPAGGPIGATFTVEAGGKHEDWPVEVCSYPDGIDFKALEEKGKFSVTVGEGARPGPRWVRLYSEQGASPPRLFFAGVTPEVPEEKDNDTIREAQAVTNLPAIVNGKLETRGDVDCYAVTLLAGQWMVAQLDAYTLDSPLDAMLHLTDSNNVKLAFQHDGCRLDPRLAWQAPRDGTFIIKVAGFAYPPRADVQFAGEASAVYRLHLHTGPFVGHLFPPVMVAGATNQWQMAGWNLPAELQFGDAWDGEDGWLERVWLSDPQFQNLVSVPVTTQPPSLETEPNDHPGDAQAAIVPFAMHGRLQGPGDVDCFRFVAKKDVRLDVAVQAAAMDFPVDAVVEIHDAEGKELTRKDDTHQDADPAFDWKVPEDGDYTLTVRDLFGRGGSDHVYRIVVTEARPDFEATLEAHTFAVERGQETDVKIEANRLAGYDGKLKIRAEGLPDGVACEEVEVPDKGGEVTLKLKAADEAAPAHAQVRFRIYDPDSEKEDGRWVRIPVKGQHADEGDLMMNRLPSAWLTVRPAKE